MAGLNKVIIIGRLGQDPELRTTATGMPVANFSVATSEKSKDGKETVEWHRCLLFGKQAELASKYLSKGKQVYLEGKIQTKTYQDKQGNAKSSTEILCHQMVFLDSLQKETQDAFKDMIKTPDVPGSYDDIPF
jgi:single-strand DNA-binding protein